MKPFLESNDLLSDPSGLRKRLRDDGYLFLRGILPRDQVIQSGSKFSNFAGKLVAAPEVRSD